MVLFLRSIIFQLFLNAYILYRIKRCKFLGQFLKVFLYIVFGIEIVLYFTGLLGRELLPFDSYVLIQKVDFYWVIFFLYFSVLMTVIDLFFLLNKQWLFYIKLKNSLIRFLGFLFIAGFFLFLGFHFHASKDNYIKPEINAFSLQYNACSGDTLSVKEQYRIAVVSDVHLGYIIDKTVLAKYVQLINEQQPDIIVIDGDLIDYYLDPLNEQQMGKELKNLRAEQGVYFIPGNHEYKTDPDSNFRWIRETGIPVLRDSVVNIGHHLQFIGRDDRRNKKKRMDWDSLMVQSDTSRIRVLFTHQPNDINQKVLNYNLPLIVSGHTHGGQLFPMNLLNSWIFTNNRGMKQKGDTYYYTTTGIGLSGFPFRISTQSEFVIFNIEIN